MSLLTMIQRAADRIGIPRPSTVIGSTDQQVRQLLALANEEGEELARRGQWQALIGEATHVTVAAELQGPIDTIAPGFDYVLNETIWDRTQRTFVDGPVAPTQWQALQASGVTGPYPFFRIRAGNLYLIPAPPAGRTIAFEYMSKNWCRNAAGDTTYDAWNADTDCGLLDEALMRRGIIWRFKQAKGLDYGEDFRMYELRLADALARDGGKRRYDLADEGPYRPGVVVPEGSWSL